MFGSPTNWHTPLYGPVAADEQALREILEGILAQSPRRIDLSFLDGGGSVAAGSWLLAANARHGSSRWVQALLSA